ncbi:MAG: hypothetical protein BJ554DRAFT_7406, partial [Olpidium bornovanus]
LCPLSRRFADAPPPSGGNREILLKIPEQRPVGPAPERHAAQPLGGGCERTQNKKNAKGKAKPKAKAGALGARTGGGVAKRAQPADTPICNRCGRQGHLANVCRASEYLSEPLNVPVLLLKGLFKGFKTGFTPPWSGQALPRTNSTMSGVISTPNTAYLATRRWSEPLNLGPASVFPPVPPDRHRDERGHVTSLPATDRPRSTPRTGRDATVDLGFLGPQAADRDDFRLIRTASSRSISVPSFAKNDALLTDQDGPLRELSNVSGLAAFGRPCAENELETTTDSADHPAPTAAQHPVPPGPGFLGTPEADNDEPGLVRTASPRPIQRPKNHGERTPDRRENRPPTTLHASAPSPPEGAPFHHRGGSRYPAAGIWCARSPTPPATGPYTKNSPRSPGNTHRAKNRRNRLAKAFPTSPKSPGSDNPLPRNHGRRVMPCTGPPGAPAGVPADTPDELITAPETIAESAETPPGAPGVPPGTRLSDNAPVSTIITPAPPISLGDSALAWALQNIASVPCPGCHIAGHAAPDPRPRHAHRFRCRCPDCGKSFGPEHVRNFRSSLNPHRRRIAFPRAGAQAAPPPLAFPTPVAVQAQAQLPTPPAATATTPPPTITQPPQQRVPELEARIAALEAAVARLLAENAQLRAERRPQRPSPHLSLPRPATPAVTPAGNASGPPGFALHIRRRSRYSASELRRSISMARSRLILGLYIAFPAVSNAGGRGRASSGRGLLHGARQADLGRGIRTAGVRRLLAHGG